MSPRRPPLTREPTEVVVDGFAHGGDGVARIEGKAVFVPGTIPGERVVVRVVDDRRNWARAEVVEVVEASPDRRLPPCPYVHPDRQHRCGGCDLQHVTPEGQRRLKTRVVREQLVRLGGLDDPPVADTLAVGPDTGYRNHAQLHADHTGRLGFHEAGSHDVVPVDRCLILAPTPQAVRDHVGDHSGAADVTVRGSEATGTAAAVLHPGPGPLDLPDGDFDLLLAQPDGSTVAMRGEGVLAEEVAGFTYRYPADGFFQTSRAGAAAIVTQVLEAAGDVDGALVWDLYAGVGLLSLPLAARGGAVVAVEGHAASAAWARRNAGDAGLDLEVQDVDVRDFVARMATPGESYDLPDVVVLDPPRTGAGIDTCRTLADLTPATIVYVACDVAALARDAAVLTAHGYTLRAAQPLDLFPQTSHVEVVARFTR